MSASASTPRAQPGVAAVAGLSADRVAVAPSIWGWDPAAVPKFPSVPAALIARAALDQDTVAMRHKRLGIWHEYTWGDYLDRASTIGAGLLQLGVGPGERVTIHADGRPEWLFLDLAAQGTGAAVAGVYPTSSPTDLLHVLRQSHARVHVCENQEQYDKVMAIAGECPDLKHIVAIDPRGIHELQVTDSVEPSAGRPGLRTLGSLAALGADCREKWVDRAAKLTPDDIAIIIYTSGTTGPPKGAMWTHAHAFNGDESLGGPFNLGGDTEVLSYLPLCHGAERLASGVMPIVRNYVVNFGEGPHTVAHDLAVIQPTFFLGVPRMWEKMMARVEIGIQESGRLQQAIYRWWMRRGRAIAHRRWNGAATLRDRMTFGLGWLLIVRSIRDKLGLRRVTSAFSGSAPIAPEVLEWLWALGIEVREAYGQTETSGVLTAVPPGNVRIGTVGVPLPGVEIRLADDGEVLAKSPGIFIGYLDDPDATQAAIDADGWLHTGDIGELDADGFLRITDRKKDIIITAGGHNVSPAEIENQLKVSPYITECVVIGDRRPYLSCLVGIDHETVANWAATRGVGFTTYADLTRQPEVVELIDRAIEAANERMARVDQVRAFRLLPKQLSHEDGEVTATQKVKRQAVAEQFGDLVEEMYR